MKPYCFDLLYSIKECLTNVTRQEIVRNKWIRKKIFFKVFKIVYVLTTVFTTVKSIYFTLTSKHSAELLSCKQGIPAVTFLTWSQGNCNRNVANIKEKTQIIRNFFILNILLVKGQNTFENNSYSFRGKWGCPKAFRSIKLKYF